MINWADSNLVWAEGRDVLSSAIPLVAEGQGLVNAFEGGLLKATPGTGNTADSFLGIAMGPRRTFGVNQKLESIVVPAVGPFTVLLGKLVNAAPGVYQANGTQIASGAGAASTTNVQYTTDATTGLTLLTFDGSFAGQAITVAYSYAMSITEEEGLFGNANPGFSAEQKFGNLQIWLLGRIAVNNWSPQANWYAGGGLASVKLTAGGVWTDANNAATGIVPANVRVVDLPSVTDPYLTLELR